MIVASKASVKRIRMTFDHVDRSMVKAMMVRIAAASIHPRNSIILFLQGQYSEMVEVVSTIIVGDLEEACQLEYGGP